MVTTESRSWLTPELANAAAHSPGISRWQLASVGHLDHMQVEETLVAYLHTTSECLAEVESELASTTNAARIASADVEMLELLALDQAEGRNESSRKLAARLALNEDDAYTVAVERSLVLGEQQTHLRIWHQHMERCYKIGRSLLIQLTGTQL